MWFDAYRSGEATDSRLNSSIRSSNTAIAMGVSAIDRLKVIVSIEINHIYIYICKYMVGQKIKRKNFPKVFVTFFPRSWYRISYLELHVLNI